jgi:hypothetical protein
MNRGGERRGGGMLEDEEENLKTPHISPSGRIGTDRDELDDQKGKNDDDDAIKFLRSCASANDKIHNCESTLSSPLPALNISLLEYIDFDISTFTHPPRPARFLFDLLYSEI